MRTPQRRRDVKPMTWPAPTLGLAADSPTLSPDPRQAARLENFFPTPEGVTLRRGLTLWSDIPSSIGLGVAQLMPLDAGAEYLYAAGESTLWNISAQGNMPERVATGLGSGDWSWCQFATTGGIFGIGVNGSDKAVILNPSITNRPLVPIGAQRRLGFNAGFTVVPQVGETLTGATSGASGTVLMVLDNNTTTDYVWIGSEDVDPNPWQNGETVTGNLGATAVLSGGTVIAPSAAPAITGVDTANLSDVWAHNRRLWFIEENSLNAWYLPIDSIGGTAVKFPLSGVFKLGGVLLFGSTYSSDSGAGLDDRLVFVTSEGEVAVYAVSADLSQGQLEGVYFIGRPLSKRARYHVGGDLVTLTTFGAVSLATAIRNGPEGLAQVSSTAPILPFWEDFVSLAVPGHRWSCVLDPVAHMLLIAAPPDPNSGVSRCAVANAVTGAWTLFTGWDAGAFAYLRGRTYMGRANDSAVVLTNQGGRDVDQPYYGIVVPRFQEGPGGLAWKTLISAQVRYAAPFKRALRLYGAADQRLPNMIAPSSQTGGQSAVWDGAATWDGGAVWAGAQTRYGGLSDWQTVYGQGQQLSIGVILGSSSPSAPDTTIFTITALYELASLI